MVESSDDAAAVAGDVANEFPTAVAPDQVEQDFPELIDDPVPSRSYHSLPVVGLGGSAGSITALQRFFETMPADSGAAFVVILHLSPSHESVLPRLLEKWTAMPVSAAEHGVELHPNAVYVIPPGKHLSTLNGQLQLTELEPQRGTRVALDLFFRSLADSHGAHATAVVLSGADGDGAIGIKRIKERGGLTVAQEPLEAEQPSMPRAAISTGMVDWVLPVGEMPVRLLDYFRREKRIPAPAEDGAQPAEAATTEDKDEQALRDVLAFLRTRTGHDFSYYKRATIVRRVLRRVQVNALENLSAYLGFLRTHPGEAGALLEDVLVSVTNFFRDREVFQALESTLPTIFQNKGAADSIRVWVPACATGEEAYSIAMLLVEHARVSDAPPSIETFGSDLDEGAIQAARTAVYPEAISADVSAARLQRFFSKVTGGYRVRRELRDIAVFAAHDLLKDAPFSRMDLISCRNLLIYLNRDAQRRALEIFHFALRPGGTLLLGASESIDDNGELFEPIDKKRRLYRQRPRARTALNVPVPSFGARAPDRETTGRMLHSPQLTPSNRRNGREQGRASDSLSPAELHFRLLERVAPPSLLINADYRVVHLSKSAGQYLEFASGEPTMNLLRVVHPMLRVELRSALFQAEKSSSPVEIPNVPFERDGERLALTIRVSQAHEFAPGFLLVMFESRPGTAPVTEADAEQRAQQPIIELLERELDTLNIRLREYVEEYEANAEELKASNDELQASNEELRSATEEVETSREEVQSVNEELAMVNSELKSKLEELAHTNSDLHNLMASTAIPTIFLDRELCIMRYTPSAVALFSIISSDLGRPLADLQPHLDYPRLHEDACRVLENLVPIERHVRAGGHWYLARLLPYRTVEDRIAGVVLTFVDISGEKRTEDALRESQQRLELVVENARDYAIFSLDLERRVTSWNSGAHSILGYAAEEALGLSADIIFTPEDRAAGAPEQEARRALSDGRAMDERWHLRKDGTRFWGSGILMPMHDAEHRAIGFVKVFRDETEQRRAKEALEQSRHELIAALRETDQARAEAEAAGRAKDHFLAVLSHELRTPLTPVLMATRALSRRRNLPLEAAEALAMIERNVQLEAHFIDDLLDVTRIARGKLDILREPLDVHDAVRRAIEVSRSDIDSKGQDLSVQLNASQHRVYGDARRLQQVFWNLLKNASKFTPRSGSIYVGSRSEAGRVEIEVRDTGTGFDPAVKERIFSAFEQANETISREFGGLGLGLAIAKATVEAHGGTIRAESDGRGRGATIVVTLALHREEEA